MTKAPVICVDGPSGAGKGTLSTKLAEALGWHLLDSGALYRIVGYACVLRDISWHDEARVVEVAETLDVRFVPLAIGCFSLACRSRRNNANSLPRWQSWCLCRCSIG
jgi:cytidylate kinase